MEDGGGWAIDVERFNGGGRRTNGEARAVEELRRKVGKIYILGLRKTKLTDSEDMRYRKN